jgi:RNA polymerase sigma-70 factor (ECF subfamily)
MTRTRPLVERAVASVGASPRLFGADAAAAGSPRLGDAEAGATRLDLRALFDAHYASIWRLLRRLGVRREQLDDASQEVFRVAARRLGDIRAGSEHAFLYGVALRVASDAARRRSVDACCAGPEPLERLAMEHPNPEERLEQRQALQLLDGVLDALPLELRTVFVLFELEGLRVKDIAALEGLPEGTVSSRLRRAREEFSAVVRRLRARCSERKGGRP